MENIYKNLILNAPFGYLSIKAQLTNKGDIIDFKILEFNTKFQKTINIDENSLSQKKLSSLSPDFFEKIFIISKEIALNGGQVEIEYFCPKILKHYRVQVFSQEKYIVHFTFIDISKIKIAEKKIIKNHVNYEKLLESSHVGILVIQKDKFIYANPIAQIITEHTMDELLHKNINELIITEEREFDEYFDEKKVDYVKPYFVSVKTKNNKTKWLEISATDIEWNQKKSVLLFLTDITKKKESEDALIESEHRKNSIINSMNNTLLILDMNLVFKEFYTPNTSNLLMAPDEFIGKCFTKINFPNPAFSIIYKALLEIIKTKEPQNVEYFLKIGNDTQWFNASITVVEDNCNEILIVIRNITKIKEIEKEIYLERDLFSKGPVATFLWKNSPNWPILRVSENIKTILGYENKDLINKEYNSLIHPEDLERTNNEVFKNINENINSFEQSYRLKNVDGKYNWFYDFTKIIRDKNNQVIEIRGYIFNQNHIKDIEFQLEKERKRLENIIDSNSIGTWEWNVQTGETIFNERWAEIVGYTLDELKPISIDTWIKLVHPDDVEKSTSALNAHFRGESNQYECEVRMKHKNGHWVWVLDKGKVLNFTPEGKAHIMFGTHTDITERKAFERKIIEVSIRDPLTNIYNRRHIFSRLNEIKAKYERDKIDFSIAILDIDYFKKVNDNFGHLAGDFVLQEFTKILGKNIRPFDLLGRFGGEEFIIIMLNCKKDTASLRIEDILKIIRSTNFIYKNQRINFTFSAGISDSSDREFENLSLDRLIDNADKKLYLAKKLGRNRIITELEE